MQFIDPNINGLHMQALVKKTSSSETSVAARATLSTAASRIFQHFPRYNKEEAGPHTRLIRSP
ncbi:MAG: hypothetical protein HC782_01620 [Gammaproteobacteria bacterium]|nr:hypothetical protein [Gammaproteobacteria bacterium]